MRYSMRANEQKETEDRMEDWRKNMIKQTQQKSDRNEIFVVLNA